MPLGCVGPSEAGYFALSFGLLRWCFLSVLSCVAFVSFLSFLSFLSSLTFLFFLYFYSLGVFFLRVLSCLSSAIPWAGDTRKRCFSRCCPTKRMTESYCRGGPQQSATQ